MSAIYDAWWPPDGTHLVSASADSTAQVWDANTGSSILTYKGQTTGVNWAAWSPDGTRIVTTSHDQTAQVWDATTGKALA